MFSFQCSVNRSVFVAAMMAVAAMGCGAEKEDSGDRVQDSGIQEVAEPQEAKPVELSERTKLCVAFFDSETARVASVPLINCGVDWMVSASARTNRMLVLADHPERLKLIPMIQVSDDAFFNAAEPDDWDIIHGNAMRGSYSRAVEIALATLKQSPI